jgi:small subunit ribosomal protein S9
MTTDPTQDDTNSDGPAESAETPAADAPAADAAAVESVDAEVSAEAPSATAPSATAPSAVVTPVEDSPAVETPEIETPAVEAATAEAPEIESAATETPDLAVPSSELPDLTLGEGEPGTGEAVVDPNYQPTIRGKIDRFGVAMGTGRRKTSVARVRIKDGSGSFTVNGKSMDEFLCLERDQNMVQAPLKLVEKLGKVDVFVRVQGGGTTGQTGAIVLGIARALQGMNETWHSTLADAGFLTRDDRMVERKKFGLRKARRAYQFSKR